MKKLLAFVLVLGLCVQGYADTIAAYTNIGNGDTADAPTLMTNLNLVRDEVNGSLSNVNISATAAIVESKLNCRNLHPYNLINNGDMEAWDAGTATYPAGWVAESVPSAIARDTANTGSGAYAVKFTTTDANDGAALTLTNLKVSTIYRLSCRAKATAGDTAKILTTGATTNVSATTTSATWADLTGTFTTDGSGTDVVVKIVGSGGAGDVVWFDQVVCMEGSVKTGYAPPPATLNIVWAAASSDAVDVQQYGADIIVMANTSAGTVTIGGLANGVDGQRVYIVKNNSANSLVIEHNEGAGTQKIYTADTVDITMTNYGGVTLVCLAGIWYEVGQ